MSIFKRFGQAPNKSFRYFLIGLLLFIVGVGIFYSIDQSNEQHILISLAFIGLGCIFAIWGYIGIFSARMLTMMNRHPATKKEDSRDNNKG